MRNKTKYKRYRKFQRLGALLSSLLCCVLLTVPAFASNNASTLKWYVAEVGEKMTESGENGRYLRVTPYLNGNIYAAVIRTEFASIQNDDGEYDIWVYPANYPKWFRETLPLGANAYIQMDKFTLKQLYLNGADSTSSSYGYYLYLFDEDYAFSVTSASPYSAAQTITADFSALPLRVLQKNDSGQSIYVSSSGYWLGDKNSGASRIANISTAFSQLTYSMRSSFNQNEDYWSMRYLNSTGLFYNAEYPGLGFYIMPYFTNYAENNGYVLATVELSFWIDANKLPEGLDVGDSFPADDSSFDDLREELLEQFPEAEDHILSDKDKWNSLRDAETIDEDTAATVFELLGGVFSIDMFATIALMVCGFTVLLILTRKAMN